MILRLDETVSMLRAGVISDCEKYLWTKIIETLREQSQLRLLSYI